ncbi:hypothetical protein K661_01918 [Piscirickettsia salmonis LF-89 = ATCC VR-1361]|nr:hypothetical protein K661_01918 [Piscirickettsia salmonis LF-89 = ATCC VR-1361]
MQKNNIVRATPLLLKKQDYFYERFISAKNKKRSYQNYLTNLLLPNIYIIII